MLLLAEGGFISDVTALIVALGGFVAAIVGLLKYLDERRKREMAEQKLKELLGQLSEIRVPDANEPETKSKHPLHDQLKDILDELNERGGPAR